MSETKNVEKYNKFISLLTLSEINLGSLTCTQNPEALDNKVSLDIAISYGISEVQQSGLEIMIEFEFRVKAFFNKDETSKDIEDISPEETMFDISLTLLLKYNLSLSDEDIEKGDIFEDYADILEPFSENVVSINAWPYVRELVSNLTGRMGFRPLMIPLKKTI
ncbi:hypothetical protein D3C75_388710 [compost metagenome]